MVLCVLLSVYVCLCVCLSVPLCLCVGHYSEKQLGKV